MRRQKTLNTIVEYKRSRKPTVFDTSANEEKMCKGFIRALKQHEQWGSIKPNSVIHIPNGQRAGDDEKARKIAGSRAKHMGALAGCPDYLVRLPGGGIGWLEAKIYKQVEDKIKATYGSLEQRAFRDDAIARGEKHEFFRTEQEGFDILKAWGVMK